ncbi:unnamed protein product, partial [Prorocentrum cordatum]
ASCSTMTCSGNQVLSQSANTLWCSSDPCGEADAEKCCVDAASCDDLRSSCPSGKSLVYRSKEVLCVKRIVETTMVTMRCARFLRRD